MTDFLGITIDNVLVLTGNTAKDSLTISYTSDAFFNGYLPASFECTAYLGKDSVIKEVVPLSIGTSSILESNCVVPDLSIVEETTPEIPSFTISPNLFTDRVWINVGTDFANLQLQVFDTRGRLVRAYDQLWAENVKLELSDLSSGMYILRIEKNGESIYVGKMIKR